MNTEDTWFALEITVISEASEGIEFALNELDASGTEINNLGKSPTAALVVNGYFRELPNDETIRAQINEALRIYGFSPDAVQKISSRRIDQVDWLYEWKKHWKSTETGKFIVAPTWENVEKSDKIVIWIDPNMAFGTGTHETTRLCLKAIEENYQSGMSFLDVGTGTGILTIAAAKLHSKSKTQNLELAACDTDEGSVTIAKENAKLNEIGGEIDFNVGSISEENSEYDFVCANLTIGTIVPILSLLLEKSKRMLVLSGILLEQKDSIIEELKVYDIVNPKIETSGAWISILIEKQNNNQT